MSVEQEHIISRPAMKGPQEKYFNIHTNNILSSISNIIKPNDDIVDTSIDKDIPYGERWYQMCIISSCLNIRRKIEYLSYYDYKNDYEELCDDIRNTARNIQEKNYTYYDNENNFKQTLLLGGCPREDVVDLRTRNVKKYSNFPWETNFPSIFTMCYVVSLDSELYNRRTGFNVFSNSLVDVYFTNIEYKTEKQEKSIVLKIDEGDYLDRNEILSVCYVYRLLKNKNMRELFNIDYKLVITDYQQKTFEITKRNYILLNNETYTVKDLLKKTDNNNEYVSDYDL
jgi:hypothetical protein